MKAFVDADIVCHRSAWAAEKSKYLVAVEDCKLEYFDTSKDANAHAFGEPVWSRKHVEPVEGAINAADESLLAIRRALQIEGNDLVLVLSGPGNFRHKYATRADYKGNRTAEKPTHFKAVREHLINQYKAIVTQGEEADDRLGILMTESPNSICCSIDKDLLQVPGWHYNIKDDELLAITEREGDLRFYGQVLSGDSTDNIPGLTGIGPKKAAAALGLCLDPQECWETCLEMYAEEFGKTKGKAYALEAARLVFIRRRPRQIWNPPNPSDGFTWHRPAAPCPVQKVEFAELED